MITQEDKERIKYEEIFRDEIRKTLIEKERASVCKKSWKFINSPFGLWLLSTVLVGLIVYIYNDSKSQNEISANNAATIQKLETETSNRLQQFKLALASQKAASIYYQKEDLAYKIDGTLIIDGSLVSKKPVYIFPEHKERTMNSLLYEIGRLTIDKNKESTITKARMILGQIQDSLLHMENEPIPDFSISQRIQSIAQNQPENLSPGDAKLFAEYQQAKKSFEQGELSIYRNKIKKELDDLLTLFQSNSFLKAMSGK